MSIKAKAVVGEDGITGDPVKRKGHVVIREKKKGSVSMKKEGSKKGRELDKQLNSRTYGVYSYCIDVECVPKHDMCRQRERIIISSRCFFPHAHGFLSLVRTEVIPNRSAFHSPPSRAPRLVYTRIKSLYSSVSNLHLTLPPSLRMARYTLFSIVTSPPKLHRDPHPPG